MRQECAGEFGWVAERKGWRWGEREASHEKDKGRWRGLGRVGDVSGWKGGVKKLGWGVMGEGV